MVFSKLCIYIRNQRIYYDVWNLKKWCTPIRIWDDVGNLRVFVGQDWVSQFYTKIYALDSCADVLAEGRSWRLLLHSKNWRRRLRALSILYRFLYSACDSEQVCFKRRLRSASKLFCSYFSGSLHSALWSDLALLAPNEWEKHLTSSGKDVPRGGEHADVICFKSFQPLQYSVLIMTDSRTIFGFCSRFPP